MTLIIQIAVQFIVIMAVYFVFVGLSRSFISGWFGGCVAMFAYHVIALVMK